jgi:hypothetical protein
MWQGRAVVPCDSIFTSDCGAVEILYDIRGVRVAREYFHSIAAMDISVFVRKVTCKTEN